MSSRTQPQSKSANPFALDSLPSATQKRLLRLFNLPKNVEKDFLIGSRQRAIQSVLESPGLARLRFSTGDLKSAAPACEHERLEQFRCEANYIIALCQIVSTRPRRDDLRPAAKNMGKMLNKHVGALHEYYERAQKETTWEYIRDALDEAYEDATMTHSAGQEATLSPAHFFATLDRMHYACQHMNAVMEKALHNADAPGGKAREHERRNRALVALASSYELCFDKKPTGTYDAGFDRCARAFLQRAGLTNGDDGKNELAEDTITDLIKRMIRDYNKIRIRHLEKWRQSQQG